jgi:hypothetical protein
MTTEEKHLWEYDHPYYCTEGNYLASPVRNADLDCWGKHDPWQDFYDAWGDSDPDYNLVFRWDWNVYPDMDDECEETGEPPRHVLNLFFMLQRKAFNKSVEVAVTPEDEPAVRQWLQERSRTIVAIRQPLIEQPVVVV